MTFSADSYFAAVMEEFENLSTTARMHISRRSPFEADGRCGRGLDFSLLQSRRAQKLPRPRRRTLRLMPFCVSRRMAAS